MSTVQETARAKQIAKLNDDFRTNLGLPQKGRPPIPGMLLITCGIGALPGPLQQDILKRVREFSTFTADNDPHGEHDFGSFTVAGTGKIFWKIDYYADADVREGSEDPADTARSFRVLTVMLASEY